MYVLKGRVSDGHPVRVIVMFIVTVRVGMYWMGVYLWDPLLGLLLVYKGWCVLLGYAPSDPSTK